MIQRQHEPSPDGRALDAAGGLLGRQDGQVQPPPGKRLRVRLVATHPAEALPPPRGELLLALVRLVAPREVPAQPPQAVRQRAPAALLQPLLGPLQQPPSLAILALLLRPLGLPQ